MKPLFFLLTSFIFLFSCNTEISSEQYKPRAKKDCLNSFTKKFLTEDASLEEKEKFCDCYVDYMIDGQETVSFGKMLKKAKDADGLADALDQCKKDATKVKTETTDSLSLSKIESEPNTENLTEE